MKGKTIQIKDLASYIKALSPLHPLAMYRGQGSDRPLLPSIGRYPEVVRGYQNWRVFHDDLIEEFLRLGRPHFPTYPKSAVEAWVLAQHHGVPTRLLDTTTNPLKALFFAVDNLDDDGVVWSIEFTSWRTELKEEHSKFWETELCPYLPAQYNPRLTAQEGAFILCPLPKNTKPMIEINKVEMELIHYTKVIVPKKSKPEIRRELNLLGCNSRLLFPDLDGVARGIRLTVLGR
jgi:hypothetical protein